MAMVESFLATKKISQSEREDLAKMFRAIDSDGSGMIDYSELL